MLEHLRGQGARLDKYNRSATHCVTRQGRLSTHTRPRDYYLAVQQEMH